VQDTLASKEAEFAREREAIRRSASRERGELVRAKEEAEARLVDLEAAWRAEQLTHELAHSLTVAKEEWRKRSVPRIKDGCDTATLAERAETVPCSPRVCYEPDAATYAEDVASVRVGEIAGEMDGEQRLLNCIRLHQAASRLDSPVAQQKPHRPRGARGDARGDAEGRYAGGAAALAGDKAALPPLDLPPRALPPLALPPSTMVQELAVVEAMAMAEAAEASEAVVMANAASLYPEARTPRPRWSKATAAALQAIGAPTWLLPRE